MWKQAATNLLTRFILIFVLTAHLLDTARALSDKRLCADKYCKEIISLGTAIINYPAREDGMVSFPINSNVRIKSKSAGNDPSLWGVEVNGREGYAPKKFIRETKILIREKDLKFTVDVEPKKTVPVLASSETLLGQENIVETKTTTPLNLTPEESTENPLKKSANEKPTAGSSPVATPVLSQVVDGTEIPMYANDGDTFETKPVTSNEAEDTDYDEDGEVENFLDEPDVSNSNISNLTKGSVEKVNGKIAERDVKANKSVNKGEMAQSLEQLEENTKRSDGVPQKDSVQKIQSYTKVKEETTNFDESSGKEARHTSVNKNPLNIGINDKKDPANIQNSTNSVQNQKLGTKTEMVPENSRQGSNAEEVINAESSNSTNSSSNFKKDTFKIAEEQEYSKVEEMQVGTKSKKEETSNREFFQNPAIVSENSKEEETKYRNDPEYSVENKNPTSETERYTALQNEENKTTVKADESHGDADNIDDKNADNNGEFSGDNSEISKDEEQSSNSSTLDETSPKTHANMNLNNAEKSMNENSTYQQELAQTAKYNNEDPVHKFKTDKEGNGVSFPEENLVKKPVTPESVTLSNADKKGETQPNMNLKNEGMNSLPAKVNDFSEENPDKEPDTMEPATGLNAHIKIETSSQYATQSEYMSKTSPAMDFPQKHLSSENKSGGYKTTNNNNVLESDKTNISINNIKDVEEILDSDSKDDINSENLNNKQEAISEQDYKEIHSKQFKIDEEETLNLPYYKLDNTPNSDENAKTSSDYMLNTDEVILNTTPPIPDQVPSEKETVLENVNPPKYNPNDDIPLSTPLPTKIDDYSYEELIKSNMPPNDHSSQQTVDSEKKLGSSEEQTTERYNSIPTISSDSVSQPAQMKGEQANTLPPSLTPFDDFEGKENKGLFATIIGTVNNMLSMNKKNKHNDGDSELDRILFSKKSNNAQKLEKLNEENTFQYCKNIVPGGDCPEMEKIHESSASHFHHTSSNPVTAADLTFDTFLKSMASKILEISQQLAFLVIVAAATLFFIFGYYCFCNSSREGALLSKLNQLESSFLASHKENAILKHNLMSTRQKLASIEDNSFGSNDMVVSLKKELEEELMEKARLQEQITVLQKELENAADAGIELNKIVSELLSNQTGDESIISSVEELQKQLNEQQNTIFEINASLAEKSRENSELQLLIAEQNARYETELASVQRDNDELEHEKGNLLTKLDEMKKDFDKDITAALEGKNMEIKRLQNEIVDLTNKLENEHTKWQTSVAKIEALEECLKNLRRDPNVNITEVIDVAYVKAQLIEIQKKYNSLKERHGTELDSRKLAESQLEVVSAEVEKLKQDFNQSEKDKLEAQTRLEVLSNYFKDKENQLQKELSLKEAMWLKQQGETTTTVDRLTAMQEEIQSLKSQNDSLRAEIEAQVAAHKAQTGTLENRAHETWLAARQSDRRYEEARAEATALRRKLTALAGGNVNEVNKPSAASTSLGDDLTQAPSPIHMESPGSPMLGRMPPPPFLPPPFMGHPPPFMGMPPPPPFVPPGEMRPAPLGRIMSPPPQRSGRFSPHPLDYEDYLDYDNNNTWHRHTYSPPPRTYRSLSPTDSRYNYGTERDLMSTYDTETDFSPPPSPRESRRRIGNSSERIDSYAKISYGSTKKFNTSNNGPLSSGSEKSFNTPSHNETKTRKGNASGGGKSLV